MLDLDAIKRRLHGQHPGPWESDEDFYDHAIKPLAAEVEWLRSILGDIWFEHWVVKGGTADEIKRALGLPDPWDATAEDLTRMPRREHV